MPQTYSPTSLLSSDPFATDNPENSRSPLEDAGSVLERLRLALEHFAENPEGPALWMELVVARRAASEAIARLPRKDTRSPVVEEARRLVVELARCGATSRTVDGEALKWAGEISMKGWPGMLAAMLMVPAWQMRSAPMFSDVPDWLVADYVRWLFDAPQVFEQQGNVETYATHTRKHLQDLAGWVQRSPGSVAVKTAAETYLSLDHSRALAASDSDLRAYALARGIIAKRILVQAKDDFFPNLRSRIGRRLRVGVVAEHFGVGPETRLLLPLFEQLDNEHFEVQLFSGREELVPTLNHAGEKLITWVLPLAEAEQLSVLRAAELDVLVFGLNLSARFDSLSQLALQRIAPLQVALPVSGHTTGLASVDLFVAGEHERSNFSAEQFTERLGLWPGPSHVVNRDLGRQAATQSWTKTSLGMPEDAMVFVSEAAYDYVTPEVIETWAELLAKVPGSQLILHPFGSSSVAANAAARFGALVEAALQRHGVDTSRLLLSTLELANPGDVQALLSVGDIYLETFPTNGVEGLLRALEAGLPVVACEGKTLRSSTGAAWLQSLGLDALVAKNATGYVATASRLAADPAVRSEAAASIKKQLAYIPRLADGLAVSDGFGALLETAFDQVSEIGTKGFVADRTPLRPASLAPVSLKGRWELARQLMTEGRVARAVDYFMAALGCDDGTAALWLDAARALRANRQSQDAIQALETALRLDQSLIEGWQLLAELADQAMIPDLAAEARQIIATLTPGRPAAATQPKVESIVGKLRSLRVARRGIV